MPVAASIGVLLWNRRGHCTARDDATSPSEGGFGERDSPLSQSRAKGMLQQLVSSGAIAAPAISPAQPVTLSPTLRTRYPAEYAALSRHTEVADTALFVPTEVVQHPLSVRTA